MKDLRPDIKEIRDNAPPHLGLIPPYIKEMDGIPEPHRRILNLIQSIPEYGPPLGRVSDDSSDDPGTRKGIEETMKKKLPSRPDPLLPDDRSSNPS